MLAPPTTIFSYFKIKSEVTFVGFRLKKMTYCHIWDIISRNSMRSIPKVSKYEKKYCPIRLCVHEYSKIWNIAKSNKSELWNRLSYRGLPYLFEVRSQTFRYDFQKIEVAASLIQHLRSFDLNNLERPNWEFKKIVIG